MKTVCIYHSIDLDGWMSAAIVKHWFIENNEFWTIKDHSKTEFYTCTNRGLIGIENLQLDFIGYNYGQPIPDLSEYDKIIMCDISFPVEEMEKLILWFGKNFIWIDHHISAISTVKNPMDKTISIEGLQDSNFAACELTWKYFFPEEPMPEIVRLLGRYDCFGHKTKSFEMSSDGYDKAKQYLKEVSKLKEFEDNKTSTDGYSLVHYANDVAKLLSEEQKVLEFQYGARQFISNYEDAYDYLIQCTKYMRLQDEVIVNQILQSGKFIYSYLCTEAKQTYKNGFDISFRFFPKIQEHLALGFTEDVIYKFICINKERFNPINFGIDYHKDGYDGAACFHYNGETKKWHFSLYNDNGEVDCSQIAKQYGGGGHKGASGFVIDDIKNII